LRLFLAIAVSPEIRGSLERAVNRLRESRAAVRWLKPDAVHQTVKYLGDTPEDDLDGLIRSMRSVCADVVPFPITVTGLGAYPDARRPRIVWAAVREPSGTLQQLWKDTEEAAHTLGWQREKRGFTPHITLGRVKGSMNIPRLREIIRSMENEHWGEQEVRNLVLYRSHLKPGGAEYEIVHVFPFGRA
jgi:2'-5' RNA ligase